tara:strand:- start:240 stop:497 length:258 start_codon:yes stop_codon:yes gene_type:complete
MTKVFIIAIVMWWADPTATPTKDSVEITHKHGLPLYFATQQECFNHVDDNIDALKEYGKAVFPTAHTVKSIYCLEREKVIDNNEV